MKQFVIRTIAATIMMFAGFAAYSANYIAEADSAYAKGEYATAVDKYRLVAEKEGVSSELWFNMGNSYAKGGYYGRALVCYVRSLRLDPSNAEAKANIKYIETKVADNNRAEMKGKKLSVEPESPSFFRNVRFFISRDHLSDTWAVWGAVCFVLFILCAAAYIFSSNVAIRKIGFFTGWIALGITVIAIVFACMAASYRSNEGVIVESKVKLLSDPSTSAKEAPVALTRGTRMEILDSLPAEEQKAQWYKVRLNSDFVGWIHAEDFEPIEY